MVKVIGLVLKIQRDPFYARSVGSRNVQKFNSLVSDILLKKWLILS